MRLIWLTCGALAVNTYIIGADTTTDCAVIDPGDAAPVLERLENDGLHCTHILITHGHFDHIGGVAELKYATGAKVYVHFDDEKKLASTRESLAFLIGQQMPKATADVLLHDGDTIEAAGLTIRVLHTPGHCAGAVAYVLDEQKLIFCGDTLFCEGVGRTDFPGCSQDVLYRSIAKKLYPLGDDYIVYCGHGESTTIGNERRNNPLTEYVCRT